MNLLLIPVTISALESRHPAAFEGVKNLLRTVASRGIERSVEMQKILLPRHSALAVMFNAALLTYL